MHISLNPQDLKTPCLFLCKCFVYLDDDNLSAGLLLQPLDVLAALADDAGNQWTLHKQQIKLYSQVEF